MSLSMIVPRSGAVLFVGLSLAACGSGAQAGSTGQPSTIGGEMSGASNTATGATGVVTGSTTTGTSGTTTGTTSGSGGRSPGTTPAPGGESSGGRSPGAGGRNVGTAEGGSDDGVADGGNCSGDECEVGGFTGDMPVGDAGCAASSFGRRIANPCGVAVGGAGSAEGGASAGGSSGPGGADPGPDGDVADDFNACEENEDCVVVPVTCCGSCGAASVDDATAVNSEQAPDFRLEVCGEAGICPACFAENDQRLSTYCDAGKCILERALD